MFQKILNIFKDDSCIQFEAFGADLFETVCYDNT